MMLGRCKFYCIAILWLLEKYKCSGEVYRIGAIFDKNHEIKEKVLKVVQEEINSRQDDIIFELSIRTIEYDNPLQAKSAICDLLKEGIVAVLGPSSEHNSNIVQAICDVKEIPHIEVRWEDRPQMGTIVNIHPYPETLTRVYTSILEAWNWEDFVILYEDNESLRRIAHLLRSYNSEGPKIIVRQLDSLTGNYRGVLKDLWRSGATRFFLDCSAEVLGEVLKQAQQVGLMTHLNHYLIANLDMQTFDLTDYQYCDANITGLRFIDPDRVKRVAVKILEEEDWKAGWKMRLDMALLYDAVMMFREALKLAPVVKVKGMDCMDPEDRWPSGQTVVNFMKGLDYAGLAGSVQFDTKGLRSQFSLEVIELREGGFIRVGSWNSTEGLNITRDYPKSASYDELSLANKTFVVITSLTEPYGMLKESTTQLYGNDRFEGFGIDLIHELSVMEGFNYTFILRQDKKYGAYDIQQKKWTGMIGDLIDGRADLAITDLTITMEREEAVDFTTPFMTLGISILFQKPKKAPPSFFSFAGPFAFEIWQLLCLAYFGVSIALFVLGRICPAEWQNPYPCVEEPEYLVNMLSLRNCFWFAIGSLMQQGSEIAPIAISTRMVACAWWFFTLIMVSSYTANLAAFLTSEKPDAMFNDVFELVRYADEKGITYGAKSGGATENFFKNSTQFPEYQKIWQYMQAHKNDCMVLDNKVGVDKAESEHYAFFMESTSIEYEIQRRCNLVQVGNLLDEKGYGIAMRKNSTYRNVLSSAILKLQESGRMADLKRKWWEERRGGGLCMREDSNSEATRLDLKDVGGVFWVTVGGAILACFLVFVEMVLHVGKESIKRDRPFVEGVREELRFYFRFSGRVKPVVCRGLEERRGTGEVEEEVPYGRIRIGEDGGNRRLRKKDTGNK